MRDARHQTSLEMSLPVAPEVEVAADIALKVKVRCSAGCDLRGGFVKIMASEAVLAVRALVAYDEEEEGNETEAFSVKAPEQLGDHVWSILYLHQESDGVIHEQCLLPLAFKTKPQRTSLAVWAIPSPVVMGEPFTIKIGAKSSGSCDLAGAQVDILDQAGVRTGSGRLGDTPWPESGALYWTDVELMAPMREGVASWSVRFAATELALPHAEARSQFSFVAVRPPEVELAVRVLEKGSQTPIENAQVRAGAFRCTTDSSGRAVLALPKGVYTLAPWKAGYFGPTQTVEMTTDMQLQLALVPRPQDQDDERWM